jgi:hypothetical protein
LALLQDGRRLKADSSAFQAGFLWAGGVLWASASNKPDRVKGYCSYPGNAPGDDANCISVGKELVMKKKTEQKLVFLSSKRQNFCIGRCADAQKS